MGLSWLKVMTQSKNGRKADEARRNWFMLSQSKFWKPGFGRTQSIELGAGRDKAIGINGAFLVTKRRAFSASGTIQMALTSARGQFITPVRNRSLVVNLPLP